MTIITVIEHDLESTINCLDEESATYQVDMLKHACKDLSVRHTITQEGATFKFVVFGQKCALSSEDTNTLFDVVLWIFDYNMYYGGLGGVGCEMSISVFREGEE